MLTQPPTYSSLIERHELTVVAKGGDLVLTPGGDLAITKDGDLQNGSIAHNAMFRLTEAWRLNSPSLRLMFDTVRELRASHAALEEEAEVRLATFWWSETSRPFEAEISAYHTANDELGAATLGRGALAGSLMIVTAALLERFRMDAHPTDQEWNATAPLHGGYSVGQAVIAAANSFRHMAEWHRSHLAGGFKKQQLTSIKVLVAALGLNGPVELFDDTNPSERLTYQIGEQGFDQLEGTVLKYANAVAVQVEARSPPVL